MPLSLQAGQRSLHHLWGCIVLVTFTWSDFTFPWMLSWDAPRASLASDESETKTESCDKALLPRLILDLETGRRRRNKQCFRPHWLQKNISDQQLPSVLLTKFLFLLPHCAPDGLEEKHRNTSVKLKQIYPVTTWEKFKSRRGRKWHS